MSTTKLSLAIPGFNNNQKYQTKILSYAFSEQRQIKSNLQQPGKKLPLKEIEVVRASDKNSAAFFNSYSSGARFPQVEVAEELSKNRTILQLTVHTFLNVYISGIAKDSQDGMEVERIKFHFEEFDLSFELRRW